MSSVAFQQIVGSNCGGNTGSTASCGITTKAASSLLIACVYGEAATSVADITDTGGLTWTQIGEVAYNTDPVGVYWAINTKGASYADTISITFSGSSAYWAMLVLDVTGYNSSNPIGSKVATPKYNYGSSAPITTASNVSGNSGDMIVAMAGNWNLGTDTWKVDGTNPSGMAIPTGGTQSTTDASIALAYAVLTAPYNNTVQLDPQDTFGNNGGIIGFQIQSPTLWASGGVTGSAKVSGSGTEVFSGAAAVTSTAVVAASGFKADNVGAAAVAGTASVSGTGGETFSGTAAVAGSGTVSASGTELFSGAAAVNAAGATAGIGAEVFSGPVQVAAQATAAAAGLTYPPLRFWPRAKW